MATAGEVDGRREEEEDEERTRSEMGVEEGEVGRGRGEVGETSTFNPSFRTSFKSRSSPAVLFRARLALATGFLDWPEIAPSIAEASPSFVPPV